MRTGSPPSSKWIEDSGKRTVFVFLSARIHLFNSTDRGVLKHWDDMRPSVSPVALQVACRLTTCERIIEWALPGERFRDGRKVALKNWKSNENAEF